MRAGAGKVLEGAQLPGDCTHYILHRPPQADRSLNPK